MGCFNRSHQSKADELQQVPRPVSQSKKCKLGEGTEIQILPKPHFSQYLFPCFLQSTFGRATPRSAYSKTPTWPVRPCYQLHMPWGKWSPEWMEFSGEFIVEPQAQVAWDTPPPSPGEQPTAPWRKSESWSHKLDQVVPLLSTDDRELPRPQCAKRADSTSWPRVFG